MIRIEPVITEIERRRERAVLIIAHQAVLRALYGYLAERKMEEVPHLDIPLHTVIELTPRAYGVEETRHTLLEAGKHGPDASPAASRGATPNQAPLTMFTTSTGAVRASTSSAKTPER